MRQHITLTNQLTGTAGMAQQMTVSILRDSGFVEMSLYNYDDSVDNDRDLHKRCDGIIAGLNRNDIVVLQYPTWNTPRYDHFLISHIKAYSGVKLIIFVHDIKSIQEPYWGDIVRDEVGVLNRADLLILPSPKMETVLRGYGLTSTNIIYQTVWDYKTDLLLLHHQLKRQMFFTGNLWKFNDLKDYHGKTPILHYSNDRAFRPNDASYSFMGFRQQEVLFTEMAEGGFGLAWCDKTHLDKYYSMNQPYKFATFLAAGIPVIVRKGSAISDFVVKNQVGLLADSIEEADKLIQSISDEDYRKLYNNVRQIQYLITKGFYTRKLFDEAVENVLSLKITPIDSK